jgi:hypothetical protein
MANPPRQRQWNVEPPADAQWFSDGLLELNSFISSVTYALTKQLSRADNFRSMLKTLTIDTSNTNTFPLDFDCTLGATPEEIRVAQVKQNPPTGPVTVAYWELLSGNKIRIHNITGLAASTKYTINLIVE